MNCPKCQAAGPRVPRRDPHLRCELRHFSHPRATIYIIEPLVEPHVTSTAAADALRGTTDFTRDDGTSCNYTLVNGVPVVQIEFKTLGINPCRAIEQIPPVCLEAALISPKQRGSFA